MKNSLLMAAMLAVALSACGKKEEAPAPAAPAAAPAPAAVAAPEAAKPVEAAKPAEEAKPAEAPKVIETTSAAVPEKK